MFKKPRKEISILLLFFEKHFNRIILGAFLLLTILMMVAATYGLYLAATGSVDAPRGFMNIVNQTQTNQKGIEQ